MRRSKEKAWETFPKWEHYNDYAQEMEDLNEPYRAGYEEGYEQAEKDLIPHVLKLCEAILFDWPDKQEMAREALIRARDRSLDCDFYKLGECTKGNPGTPCQMEGCTAWRQGKKEKTT